MKLFSDIAEKITNKWEDIKLRVYSRQVIPKSKSYWGLAAAEILLMIPFTYKMQVSIFFALTNGGLPLAVIGAILVWPALRRAGLSRLRCAALLVGMCAAFLIGWILERRYVGFSTEVSVPRKLTRIAIGLPIYYAVSLILMPLLKQWLPGAGGTIASCFLQMFYVSFVFPWCARHLRGLNA